MATPARPQPPDPERRIAELEDALAERDRRIKELKADLAKAEELVSGMREHAEDAVSLIERWIEAFDMRLGDDGAWQWRASFVEGDLWFEKYDALRRQWNKFVPEYNATVSPRPVGRPLGASEEQRKAVLKHRDRGLSLRGIADAMTLRVHTVRTIVDQRAGVDRTTLRRLARIDPDRKEETLWKAHARVRKALPRQINETLERGRELVKAAKGLK